MLIYLDGSELVLRPENEAEKCQCRELRKELEKKIRVRGETNLFVSIEKIP
jgi:translation initiation factor 1 (eIF-1/SUI1)